MHSYICLFELRSRTYNVKSKIDLKEHNPQNLVDCSLSNWDYPSQGARRYPGYIPREITLTQSDMVKSTRYAAFTLRCIASCMQDAMHRSVNGVLVLFKKFPPRGLVRIKRQFSNFLWGIIFEEANA